MGYYRAGFEVVGVDLIAQPRFPFEFHQADALTYPMDGFDAIHASPPCQHFSYVTPKKCKGRHPDLLTPMAEALRSGCMIPFVIENVPGARHLLKSPIMLCGTMFGLKSWRHRYFEISCPIIKPSMVCDHSIRPLLVTTAGNNSRAIRKPGEYKSIKNAPAAYGIDWMRVKDVKEAIPPAYTEWIGKQLLKAIRQN